MPLRKWSIIYKLIPR